MNRINVSSSNIASIGYDSTSQVLEVEFHSGGTYQYSEVPQAVYSGFISAGSHGQYFHQNIKNVYHYSKVG